MSLSAHTLCSLKSQDDDRTKGKRKVAGRSYNSRLFRRKPKDDPPSFQSGTCRIHLKRWIFMYRICSKASRDHGKWSIYFRSRHTYANGNFLTLLLLASFATLLVRISAQVKPEVHRRKRLKAGTPNQDAMPVLNCYLWKTTFSPSLVDDMFM